MFLALDRFQHRHGYAEKAHTHTRRHIRTLNFQFRLPRQAPRFPHFLPAPVPFPFSRENEFRFVCWNIFSVFGGTIYWLMWPKFAGLFGD